MKNLVLITFLFGLTSCSSFYTPQEQYNNSQATYKAKAVGINSDGSKNGAWGFSSGTAILNARFSALNNCKRYSSQCIIEWENDKYVFSDKKHKDYISAMRKTCKGYGFESQNAIAMCIQTEINNEITRFENQQVYANAQARANAAQRNNALSSMGRCLSNEGSFAACGNAWNGYTPKPAKKVYKCDYDVFGNQISSTCREQ